MGPVVGMEIVGAPLKEQPELSGPYLALSKQGLF